MNYSAWKYSAGEIGLRLDPQTIDNSHYTPKFLINSSDDLMKMFLYLSARKEIGEPVCEIHLPYLPYSRQDRVVVEGDPMPLDFIAQSLAYLGVHRVITDDLHSPKNIVPIFKKYNIALLNEYPINKLLAQYQHKTIIVVYVDGGCFGRVENLRQSLRCTLCTNGDTLAIVLDKKRDPKTGNVIGMEVKYSDPKILSLPEDTIVLVYDDICDGGATFIEAAKAILDIIPKDATLHLHVTHGIFSKGKAELEKFYDVITCTNVLYPQK